MRYYLLIFYVLFFVTLMVYPSYKVYKRTGVNPVKFKESDSAIGFLGLLYKVVLFISFVVITINAFMHDLVKYFIEIDYLRFNYVFWSGLVLLHLATLWIYTAQRNMADEWRVGIDNDNKVKLVKHGVFKFSRNPIFLGVGIVFLSLVLILPNVITVVLLFVAVTVIHVQVRLEEEFLLNELGSEYKMYKAETRRWLL